MIRAASERRPVTRSSASANGHREHPGVGAGEAQRLGLPRGGAVVHPGQPGELGVGAGEQVGERAAGQVRGAQAVADVAAGARDPRRGVVGRRSRASRAERRAGRPSGG